MRLLLAFALVCMTAGVAGAVSPTAHQAAPVKVITSIGGSDTREGGEGFGDAMLIPGLPFTDSGATCDNRDDITLPCAASAAPDVVYRYVAGATGSINVIMCGSAYDTALGIYDASLVNLFCNDDFCGLQSEIDGIPVVAGQTYYIVVDGFSVNCGDYVISVSENTPCALVCPPGAMLEGEPDCYDGYYDAFNGGCNSVGWEDILPTSGNHADLCGKSGTYSYYGLSYRDTDWFTATGMGANMTMTLNPSFPGVLIFIYGTDCANPLYDFTTTTPCVPVSLSRYVADGSVVWPWVGGNQFSGIPCGSDYILSLDGIKPSGTAVENATWGAIKTRY